MGKSSAPPPPDYAAAAQQTANGNLQAAQQATEANRVNTNTPYGSLRYTQDPSNTNRWTADVTLDPQQQRLLDQQNQTSLGLAGLQNAATGRVADSMAKPFDMASLPKAPINAGTTAQNAIMARLQPQFDRSEEQLRNRLANQGIMQGSEAYNSEVENFNQGKNDAYSQAALQGIGLDTSARQNSIQEQSYLRSLPLNELNALRTGAQVQNPTFQNAPQQQTTQGADLLGAQSQTYNAALGANNAKNAQAANTWGQVAQLGGAAAMMFF